MKEPAIELDSLYREVILDHSKDPRNFSPLPGADASAEGYNPMCGDRVKIEIKFAGEAGNQISECHFTGSGCSICMASASILTEEVEGLSVEEVRHTISDFRALMQDEKDPKDFEGDVEALSGVRKFPVRIKCALLAWTTLKDALEGK